MGTFVLYPAGDSVQLADPSNSEYLPVSHCAHASSPIVSLYLPAMHFSQPFVSPFFVAG